MEPALKRKQHQRSLITMSLHWGLTGNRHLLPDMKHGPMVIRIQQIQRIQ